jgi:hypothetical protein
MMLAAARAEREVNLGGPDVVVLATPMPDRTTKK